MQLESHGNGKILYSIQRTQGVAKRNKNVKVASHKSNIPMINLNMIRNATKLSVLQARHFTQQV